VILEHWFNRNELKFGARFDGAITLNIVLPPMARSRRAMTWGAVHGSIFWLVSTIVRQFEIAK
jgi:hypothetical protein